MIKWLFGVLALELVLVASIDLKHKKISNLWSVFNLIFAVILWPMDYLGPWNFQVLLFPIGFLIVGFFLFNWKIMGAGDSKFLASLFLCLPLGLHLIFFENLMMSTIMVGAILLSMRILRDPSKFRSYLLSRHWQGLMNMVKSRFSYAPVMLLAGILMGVHLWF